MGKVDLLKNLYKFVSLSVKYNFASKASLILTNLYITVPREYMRDEVVIMATKLSQEAYKIKRIRNELSTEITQYLDGV
jgi:hypothetical protein